MNFETELFSALETLVNGSEVFYRQEFNRDVKIYWIYNYRLASYSDFQLPYAKWCRGTMFEVDDQSKMICLASLPMQKFFNLNENPETMNLDLNKIEHIEVKSDGSLMSTYMCNGQLYLKSYGSLYSEQAIDAMKFLDLPENAELRVLLVDCENCAFTANLEWVAPHNRIVLGYEKPELILLNYVDKHSGKTIISDPCLRDYKFMRPLVEPIGMTKKEFIEQVPSMLDDIEGFIFVMSNGQRVKIKTDKYISLHHAKDSVTNPRRLFECILDEASDDLRSMFATDKFALKIIEDTEVKVKHIYNHMVSTVESLHTEFKSLDRKGFALKMKDVCDPMYFGLVMNLYIGRDNDYKEFMKKRYKELGFQDKKVEE